MILDGPHREVYIWALIVVAAQRERQRQLWYALAAQHRPEVLVKNGTRCKDVAHIGVIDWKLDDRS